MIAPSLGDSMSNLPMSNPEASGLALPRTVGPKLTIALVGLSGATAVAFGQAIPAQWNRIPFADGPSFLKFSDRTSVDCVVAELHWPGVSALALHQEWRDRDPWATTVLLAEIAWPDDLSRLFPKGAVRLQRQPWEQDELRRTIDEAQRQGSGKRVAAERRRRLSESLGRLTPVERQVVAGLYQGLPHKSIASRLGVSLRTVDYRRKCALRKLEVTTLAALVRIVAEIEFADGDV
jgi:RNA polymerase sigma factor (sigma-70 family)